jgi:hypothetical protein
MIQLQSLGITVRMLFRRAQETAARFTGPFSTEALVNFWSTALLNSLGTSEMRETVLLSVTPAGADMFDALDGARHTIGVLFLLCVIVSLLLSSPLLSLSPSIASFYRYLWIIWFFFWVSSVLPPFGRSTCLTSTTTTTLTVQFAPALSPLFHVISP